MSRALIRNLIERVQAESVILAKYDDTGPGVMARQEIRKAFGEASSLDRELTSLRGMKLADDQSTQAAVDFRKLAAAVERLFNPSPEVHWKLNPEGTYVGGLVTVLEQVAARLEAIPCTCREVKPGEPDSKHRVMRPGADDGDWPADADDDVFVCTRCAALGRVEDRPAPGWEG